MTTLFDINVHKGDIGGRKNDYLYGIEEHQNAPQQVGETFKEYRNVTPYKFNGKELD